VASRSPRPLVLWHLELLPMWVWRNFSARWTPHERFGVCLGERGMTWENYLLARESTCLHLGFRTRREEKVAAPGILGDFMLL